MKELMLDTSRHSPGFDLNAQDSLYVVSCDGRRERSSMPIDRVAADAIPSEKEGSDGRAHVVVADHNGEPAWLLVRDFEPPEVLAFGTAAELGRFLWEVAAEDVTALDLLRQLNMLRFAPCDDGDGAAAAAET